MKIDDLQGNVNQVPTYLWIYEVRYTLHDVRRIYTACTKCIPCITYIVLRIYAGTQILIYLKVFFVCCLSFSYFYGIKYIHLHRMHHRFYLKMLCIFGDLNPHFYFQNPIFANLILIFRYLVGNLCPFPSELSPMLYENDWYFWRLKPPFLLPESLFLRN